MESGSGQKRFETLDALRGVGAICVIAGHSGQMLGGYTPTHFYLAVDMFFVLSGFVISYAYDKRLAAGYHLRDFVKARFHRLYPVYAFGLAIGVACLLVSNPHGLSVPQIAISTLFASFGLPSPPMGPVKALFPINGPFWSLFFEFWFANVLYAFFWKQLRGRTLAVFICAAAIAVLASEVVAHSADIGWNWKSFPGGVARVFFSFFAGVALSRLHGKRATWQSGPSLAFVLLSVVALSCPIVGPLGLGYDAAMTLLFFPALIFFAASALPLRSAFGTILGDLSYTVYAIHRPLLGVAAIIVGSKSTPNRSEWIALFYQAVFATVVLVLAWLVNKVILKAQQLSYRYTVRAREAS